MKKCLIGCTVEEIKLLFQELGQPPFRAQQLLSWLYEKGIADFNKMTTFSHELRQELEKKCMLTSLELQRVQSSDDGQTEKFLWKLSDGKLVESVLIASEDRRTVCVSSQVGCPARCAFCASGQQGFFRNLEVEEIIAQIYLINNWLKERGERVSHIVYMGMGEPFRNYESVVQSIRLLIHPNLFNISQRRITVSTVGVTEGIQRFATEELKVNLVLSLHAPNQKIRQKIIPYARQYPLDEILEAMDQYAAKTKRDITYEYTLLSGINDAEEHAHELALLLRHKQCTVNLIPYNPVPGIRLERPEALAIKRFREVLHQHRIVNTCRYTKGDDIAAACGQLALQETVEKEVQLSNRSSLVVIQ